ncbi:uncharacterized protein [Littorina saxatilis]|uniref:uncharacterized protein n=1 Tax=Littorina saxatilis TaxID=31220 RepID=UPI0038B5DACA
MLPESILRLGRVLEKEKESSWPTPPESQKSVVEDSGSDHNLYSSEDEWLPKNPRKGSEPSDSDDSYHGLCRSRPRKKMKRVKRSYSPSPGKCPEKLKSVVAEKSNDMEVHHPSDGSCADDSCPGPSCPSSLQHPSSESCPSSLQHPSGDSCPSSLRHPSSESCPSSLRHPSSESCPSSLKHPSCESCPRTSQFRIKTTRVRQQMANAKRHRKRASCVMENCPAEVVNLARHFQQVHKDIPRFEARRLIADHKKSPKRRYRLYYCNVEQCQWQGTRLDRHMVSKHQMEKANAKVLAKSIKKSCSLSEPVLGKNMHTAKSLSSSFSVWFASLEGGNFIPDFLDDHKRTQKKSQNQRNVREAVQEEDGFVILVAEGKTFRVSGAAGIFCSKKEYELLTKYITELRPHLNPQTEQVFCRSSGERADVGEIGDFLKSAWFDFGAIVHKDCGNAVKLI